MKIQQKIQNLQKLVEDIDRKIENLELQKKLYMNKIQILKEKISESDDDHEE